MHLKRGKVDKTYLLPKEYRINKLFAYSMVHFLDRHFRRRNNIVFYFFDRNLKDSITVNTKEKNESDYDIQVKIQPDFPFPLRFLKSKKYLSTLLQLIREKAALKTGNALYVVKSWIKILLEDLFCSYLIKNNSLSKQIKKYYEIVHFATIQEIHKVYLPFLKKQITHFNSVKNLLQIVVWKEIKDYSISIRHYYQLKCVLKNITGDITVDCRFYRTNHFSGLPHVHFSPFEIKVLTKHQKKLIVYSLIKMLWIATPEEKQDIYKALKQKTGESYTNHKDWEPWWYRNRHKYIRIMLSKLKTVVLLYRDGPVFI